MLKLSLVLEHASHPGRLTMGLVMHERYGSDPETARFILESALTAEVPAVLDSAGKLLRLPAGSVRQFAVWADPPAD